MLILVIFLSVVLLFYILWVGFFVVFRVSFSEASKVSSKIKDRKLGRSFIFKSYLLNFHEMNKVFFGF